MYISGTDIPDFIDTLEVILKLFSYGFFPHINTPTRVTGSTATLIDNIYTNEMSVNIEPGILINDISDHLPILCMVDYIFLKKK